MIVRPLTIGAAEYEARAAAEPSLLIEEPEWALAKRTGVRNRDSSNPLAKATFLVVAWRSGDRLEVVPGAGRMPGPVSLQTQAAVLYTQAKRRVAGDPRARVSLPAELPPAVVAAARDLDKRRDLLEREVWQAVFQQVQARASAGASEPRVSALWADEEGRLWIIREGADPELDRLTRQLEQESATVRERVERLLRS